MYRLADHYYLIKSFLPRKLQISLRRGVVRMKLLSNGNNWPISDTASKAPPNWRGWPNKKTFALVLTHDVESAYGLSNCSKLIQLEEDLGFKSSFNFVLKDYDVPEHILNELKTKGFEIGVHGVHHKGNIYSSPKEFLKSSVLINRKLEEWGAVGFRSPSMFHDLNLNHYLNIEYDASTFDTDPFEPQPDGMDTIFPFWVPKSSVNEPVEMTSASSNHAGYVELPYTIPQDFLCFILMKGDGLDLWKKKLDWIAANGGMALMITHPDYMSFNGNPDSKEYPAHKYSEFLQYVKTKYKDQYWHALPRDVARFWKSNYLEKSRKKKRICMLSYSFYENDNRVMRYAEALTKRGDHVEVVALRRNGGPAAEVIRGVNVYKIQKRSPNEKSKLSFLLKLSLFLINSAWFITRRHLKNPYDLIHVHSVPDFEVFATLIPKLYGAKTILDIHDIVPEFYASKFNKTPDSLLFKMLMKVEKASTTYADHVIISNHIWENKLLDRSVDQSKCNVILNYPDPSLFFRRPKTRNDGKFVMLYPGTLGWHQGLDIAVKAIAKIKDQAPQAQLHIYGRGPEKENLQKIISELKLEDRVFIRDSEPIERIADLMANADLGIVPKRNDPFGGEAFSTKIFEFMHLGVPLVVSRTKIDNYYFDDSLVKFFQPEDVDDLAESMMQLINDTRLRNRLVQNSLLFIEDYDWDKRKREYLKIIDQLVGEGEEYELVSSSEDVSS